MADLPLSDRVLDLQIGDDPPNRLDKALFHLLPEGTGISRTKMTKLIQAGAVSFDDVVIKGPKTKPVIGGIYHLRVPAPEPTHLSGEDIALDILYEDDEVIVLDKPVGMVVHPAPGARRGTLVHALIGYLGDGFRSIGNAQRPGIVHRIDKETSGLILVAKTAHAHFELSKQFADHTITRFYYALTKGVPNTNYARLRGLRGTCVEKDGALRIATQIGRHPKDRKRMAVVASGGRHAISRFYVRETYKDFALLKCALETGRTHQIRVHLNHIGHGIVGDKTYGTGRTVSEVYPMAQNFARQALHAATLGFSHPVSGEALEFRAPIPPDMADLIAALKENAAENP